MAYESLGIDLTELIAKGGPAIQAASKVVQDPALPEITCHVMRLNRITEGKAAGSPCRRRLYTEAAKRKGIGLHVATGPLRAFVWAKEHPAQAIGIGAGVVLGLVGIGYMLGRKR